MVCLIVGLVAILWLVRKVGAPAIADGLRAVGWSGVLAVSGFHLIATTFMGIAWWNLQRAAKLRFYIGGRLLRDAGSEVLPLSQVGGYALGARAPMIGGVAPSVVLPSVVVDASLEFLAQIAYVALGVALSLRFAGAAPLTGPALGWVVAALAAATGFILVQTRGHQLLDRVSRRFSGRWLGAALAGAALAHAGIRQIYRRPGRVLQSLLCHFTAWLVSGAEALLILHLMGVRYDWVAILVLETLLQAARSLAFAVPAAVGVQEGAYLVLGAALGIPAHVALGLSLVKRARDLVLGISAITAWHLVEGRRLRQAAAPRRAEPE